MALCSRLQQRMRPLPVWRCEDVDLESKESSVEFGSIEIREYSRELGAYSDLKNGLALGWEFKQHDPIPFDQYQKKESVPKQPSPRGGLKRALKKLKGATTEEEPVYPGLAPTTTNERQKILAGFGYSKEEITKAEDERLRKLGFPSINVTKLTKVIRKVQLVCSLGRRGSR
jgi:hypothetical protein